MKSSPYTKVYKYEEAPGYQLIYSALTGAIVLLEGEIDKKMMSNNLSPFERETLLEQGFLVNDSDNEKRKAFKLLDSINENNTRFDFIAVMNLDCNLACTYCYEGKMKGRLYMTEETADSLISFIASNSSPKTQTLNIDFYGGEPLLSKELIKYISRNLNRLAEQRGLDYGFTLVTNGTLLTRKTVEEFVPLGFKGAKITIDGLKENHDSHRPFKSGKGSFETIVRNIRSTCDLVKIGLGGNYSQDNYRSFPELLDYLINEGLTPEKIAAVKFDPIMGSGKQVAVTDFRDGCESANEPWLVEASLYLREEILRRGFNTPDITAARCMINIRDSYVLNYDGAIYKCPGLIGKKGFEIGHVRDGTTDYSSIYNLDVWKNEKCFECEYLPLCFGGCRYLKLIGDGNINGVECKKKYFDATLKAFIMQDIKYRLMK